MRAYEDQLYEQWRQQVEAVLPSLLKRNLLSKPDKAGSEKVDDVDLDKMESETGWCLFRQLHIRLCCLLIKHQCYNELVTPSVKK